MEGFDQTRSQVKCRRDVDNLFKYSQSWKPWQHSVLSPTLINELLHVVNRFFHLYSWLLDNSSTPLLGARSSIIYHLPLCTKHIFNSRSMFTGSFLLLAWYWRFHNFINIFSISLWKCFKIFFHSFTLYNDFIWHVSDQVCTHSK